MTTTDLVTYYGQTSRIDQLVDKYGACLEQINRETKLLLRMALTHYVFMQQKCNPDNYSVTEPLRDALFVRFVCEDIPRILYDICSLLQGLTVDEAETLLEALQHQIRWGNARTIVNH
ncbi:hypothetical protein FNW02_37805 [Komarekiella sp. 'clone 1']|uniref:Uncharacterized protein n=1 Tax=Komarekiella delphini-convector SJRDD-AB1 TaxID=2593771 RepID=A0AA40VVZ1_9NOST|nr:hypothetical protein [Komarekiella delphini-convector]MBD6621290.1 hypothetical protein [Komarekiella delphini-convector SJRDD-AB1]